MPVSWLKWKLSRLKMKTGPLFTGLCAQNATRLSAAPAPAMPAVPTVIAAGVPAHLGRPRHLLRSILNRRSCAGAVQRDRMSALARHGKSKQ